MPDDANTLKSYRFVWTARDHRDAWDYEYICEWADGSTTREITLPWGRMNGAVELSIDDTFKARLGARLLGLDEQKNEGN